MIHFAPQPMETLVALAKGEQKMKVSYLCLLITLFLMNGLSMSTPDLKINTSRLLLAHLRGGDYAHAGDEEAIDMVVQKSLSFDSSLKNKTVLDVGSGFGGTAYYLYQDGFKDIHGIDLDQPAITYAKEKYPSITFTAGDALGVDQIYSANSFSFISLFNVAYAIQNKAALLTKLSAIAAPGAILAVFDYTQANPIPNDPLKDLAGKPMYPLQPDQFKRDLKGAGWEILEVTDMTPHYIRWYKNLLIKLSAEVSLLKKEFSQEDLLKVKESFRLLLNRLKQGILGGIVIYARKQSD
ncbi:MAG: methyltransferase domain-containing protein [Alphaproteobacteria bacterium]|nr:methyltransferase domain-containing protein [Alphaproteobacteria bacterium]